MTVSIFDASARVVEAADPGLIIRPSPFREKRLGEVIAIERLRLDVARSPIPNEIDAQLGQLLVSAIIFGALLDRTLWRFWLAATITDGGSGDHVAFSLNPTEPRPSIRRWFVDPITRRFLDGFSSNECATAVTADPDACAEAFLSGYIGVSISLDDLVRQAEAWWRLRLPGLFVGYANRTTTSASVCSSTWKRIETGQPVIVARRPRSWAKPPGANLSAEGLDIARLKERLRQCSKKQSGLLLRAGAIAARDLLDADLETGQFVTERGAALARWQCERLVPTHSVPFHKEGGVGVEWALKQLGRVVELFEGEPPPEDEPDGADLEELYLEFVEQGATTEERGARLNAIYSFHKFMESDAGWPPIEFDIEGMDIHAIADASLISIKDYKRACAIVGLGEAHLVPLSRHELATMRRSILALGFRAGLRISEVMELTMNDLRHEDDAVELFVRSNVHRKVKSKTSRRVLPLHLFLEPAERKELVDWHQRRTRLLGQTTPRHRLFALGSGNDRLDRRDAEDNINKALKGATKDENAIFHHLRHSFASYLLGTLSLPADCKIALPAGLDESCISQSRRTKLLPTLIGHGAGRSSLYAVSAMLGHAGPRTTLGTYIHLLDWGLSQYLSRPSALSDVCPEVAVNHGPVRQAATCQFPISELSISEDDWAPGEIRPTGAMIAGWRGLARSMAGASRPEGTTLLPRRFGIDLVETFAFESRMTTIAKLKTQQGSRRHRVFNGPTDSGTSRWVRAFPGEKKTVQFHRLEEFWPMTVPRNGQESSLVDKIWPNAGLVESDENVRQSIMTFLARLDPIRCDVPLRPGDEAMKFYQSLRSLGIPNNLIRGRPQYRGSYDRNPRTHIPLGWDGTPDCVVPAKQRGRTVTRIRLTVIGDERTANADDGEASYGWRYAMVLLAATSTIDIAAIAEPRRSERTERRKRKIEELKLSQLMRTLQNTDF